MDSLFIFGAKYLFALSIIIAGGYFLLQSRPIQKKMVIFGFVSAVLTFLIALIARSIYTNPRPFVVQHFTPLIPHAPDNGFPSDHALLVGLIAAVIYPFSRKISAALWLIAIVVAGSRVYVGVHHSIDVVGSFVIAIVMTACGYWLMEGPFRSWLAQKKAG